MTVDRRRLILEDDGTIKAERTAPVVVSQTNPAFTEPGLWIELRVDNTVKTIWVENGV